MDGSREQKTEGAASLEILILIVVVGLVALVGSSRKQQGQKPPGRPPPKQNPPFRAPREPFNRRTAEPVKPTSHLKGRAYVVDGDTLVIAKTQIRLFGVDAPEMNHPYGKKAKWALVRLCKGQIVHAEVTAEDDHGRTVAKCCLDDGRDLSAEMVKLGLAIDWAKFSGGQYRTYEQPGLRKKLWLADARQKGRMHVWEQFEARQNGQPRGD